MTSVTVVLPTWNGERFIAAQLDSILRELPSHGRVLVRDDGSVDRTTEIVHEIDSRDPRVELLPAGGRLGVIHSVEALLAKVERGVVFLSDQDDLWRPGKVARCLEALENADLVVHDAARIDADGNPLDGTLFQRRGFGGGVFANVWKNRFTGCCMAFRADLLPRALPFPAIPMHDQWLGLVALRHGRVAWLPETLADYRVHGGNATATGSGESKAGVMRRILWRAQILRALVR
jgi:glycosyltransferase involved in cell wall biosynthesis